MDKIYRRPTQLGDTPKKKKNEKNRKRNMIINFRVSELEKELIEKRIKLTGLSKSEFFIQSCLYQAILVKGNIRTFNEIKDRINALAESISINSSLEELDIEAAESFRTILEILNNLYGKD